MLRKAFLVETIGVLCCLLAAQTSVPNGLLRENCETGFPKSQEWYREKGLSQGKTFVASKNRKQQVMTNYPKIKSQMSMAEVDKLLGKPDFATTLTVAQLASAPEPEPSEKRCTIETVYVLRKGHDTEDVAIYMFFSREGKLFWAAPKNLPSLKHVRSPTGDE